MEATRRGRERAPEETEPDEIDILKAVERAVSDRETADVEEQEDQSAGEPRRGSDVDSSGAGEGGGSPRVASGSSKEATRRGVAGRQPEEPQDAGTGGTVEKEQEPQDAEAGGSVEKEEPPDQGDEA